MSAYVVSEGTVHGLVVAGLRLARWSPLRWQLPIPAGELERGYQRGSWIGPGAHALIEKYGRELTEETAGRVGAMLWAENVRSVNHRYDEGDWEPVYPGLPRGWRAVNVDPAKVLSVISCYEYQSCEHPEWRESEAFAYVGALRELCCDHLADETVRDLLSFRDIAKTVPVAPEVPQEPAGTGVRRYTADEAVREIRAGLKARTGKTWSVRNGRGTGWGWLRVSSPPKRCDELGRMPETEVAELAEALGIAPHLARNGVQVINTPDAYTEFVDRAWGREPSAIGRPYWD